MSEDTNTARLEKILVSQIETMSQIYQTQQEMYKSVSGKAWFETKAALEDINNLANVFSELDKSAYSIIKEENTADFSEYIEHLPCNEKERLNCLFKELKNKIFHSKIENDVFTNYVAHSKFLMQSMVNIVSENCGGTCYTRTGKRSGLNMNSMVLNRIF